MNANRLINIAVRIGMRGIMRYFMKGRKADPNVKRTADAVKMARRLSK